MQYEVYLIIVNIIKFMDFVISIDSQILWVSYFVPAKSNE